MASGCISDPSTTDFFRPLRVQLSRIGRGRPATAAPPTRTATCCTRGAGTVTCIISAATDRAAVSRVDPRWWRTRGLPRPPSFRGAPTTKRGLGRSRRRRAAHGHVASDALVRELRTTSRTRLRRTVPGASSVRRRAPNTASRERSGGPPCALSLRSRSTRSMAKRGASGSISGHSSNWLRYTRRLGIEISNVPATDCQVQQPHTWRRCELAPPRPALVRGSADRRTRRGSAPNRAGKPTA